MSPSYLLFVFIAVCAVTLVVGDVYMQYPPGNNDRLNENGNRNNANRLFDSQNNAQGGYCWGPELTYYEGSVMSVQWTNQHACGSTNTQCNLVLQYMCSSDKAGADESLIIRDGTTTNTIQPDANPTSTSFYNLKDATGTFIFGMNEPLSYYTDCTSRERNKGLFTADQTLNGNSAMFTRQNTNGNRFGFECTEERDYYPYWHPSPWKDIAVMTDSKSQCGYYQSESQNVKDKNYCNGTTAAQKAANNQAACSVAGGVWMTQKNWGIGKPDCFEAPWNRDNHLGNGVDGHTNTYNWTLPRSSREKCIDNGNCTCVLRLRYNITVGELTGKEDYLKSGANTVLKEDPTVLAAGFNFTLALDTQQTGRTFQDRSYMFRLAPRPSGVGGDAAIYNLNVRGKRGNIVQTYPATEYDFTPTHLTVLQGDYIHFQWTGCDTNPNNNAGEGRTSTDRSNIVQIGDMSKNFPLNDTQLSRTKALFKDPKIRARFANIDQVNCLNYDDLKAAATGTNAVAVDQNPQNCMVLNQAGPRFSGALVKMDDVGFYPFMSTRNNNFSNRSQKAAITVKPGWPAWKTAVIVVGGVAAVGIGAAAGTVFYASRHPLSKVAEFVHKVPGFSKV